MHELIRDLTNTLVARRTDPQAFVTCSLAPLAELQDLELLDSLWAAFEQLTWEDAGRALGIDRRTARARYRLACRTLQIQESDGVAQLQVMLALVVQRLVAFTPASQNDEKRNDSLIS